MVEDLLNTAMSNNRYLQAWGVIIAPYAISAIILLLTYLLRGKRAVIVSEDENKMI